MMQQRLMERYLSGSATAEEVRRLDEALAHNAELRREFGLRVDIDSHLRQMSRLALVAPEEQTVGGGLQSLARESEARRTLPMAIRPRYAFFVAVLAASILLAVVLQLPQSGIVDATSVPRLGNRMHLVSCVTNPRDDLWSAARDGDVAAVNRALHRGVGVDARLEERDLTPLHVAALFGRIDVAEVLLDAGADISLTDVEGNTALHMAAFVADRDIVELLLNQGASARAETDLVSRRWILPRQPGTLSWKRFTPNWVLRWEHRLTWIVSKQRSPTSLFCFCSTLPCWMPTQVRHSRPR